MPHSIMGYYPCKLIFGHKALTVCVHGYWLASYNDNYLQSNCACINEQDELFLVAKRHI